MPAISTLRRLFSKALFSDKKLSARNAKSRRRFQPALELLEDRITPTNIVLINGTISSNQSYTNTADSYVVNGNVTINPNVTVTFGSVNVTIDAGDMFTVNGTLDINNATAFQCQNNTTNGIEGIK